MIIKTIAAAGVAGLALGVAGFGGTAVAAGAPQSGTHSCANVKAAAAHARNDLRHAQHVLDKAAAKLARAEKTHGAHSHVVKVDKAHVKQDKADVTQARSTFDAAAQKRHNCLASQPSSTGTDGSGTSTTGGTDGSGTSTTGGTTGGTSTTGGTTTGGTTTTGSGTTPTA